MRKNTSMLQVVSILAVPFLTLVLILTVHTRAFQYDGLSGGAQNLVNEMTKINGYSLLLAMGLLILLILRARTSLCRKNRVSEKIGEIYFPQIGQACKIIIQIGLVLSIYFLQYHAYLYLF